MTIKSLIKNHIVFVDTSSLMHPKAKGLFLENKEGIIGENKVIIPVEVGNELDKLIRSNNPEKVRKAQVAKYIFDTLQQKKLALVGRHNGASHVDNVLLLIFTEFRLRRNLCLITQDNALANDILLLSKNKSVRRQKSIVVLQLTDGGRLQAFTKKKHPEIPSPVKIKKSPFYIRRKPQDMLNIQKLPVKEIPRVGSPVYVENRKTPIFLTRLIYEGSKGMIYETNYEKYICKIFNKKSRNNLKYEKLRLMTSRRLDRRGICWPNSLVYNSHAEFVGYSMPLAMGEPIQKTIFRKHRFLELFPGWKKIDLVNICIDLLNKIRILHEHNVLIGDINPANILITRDKKTFFVDTDSYQVADFPCSTVTWNFTAPEIQNKDLKNFLRTKEQEYFAVATLLFMILIPGKTPYSHQGSNTAKKNIKLGSFAFPYQLENKRAMDTSSGQWRFIWSHLSYEMKGVFYDVFQNGKRLGAMEWLDHLKKYKWYLKNGKGSNEIYNTFTKSSNE